MLPDHRLDVDEYHRMAHMRILSEDDRVELLDGEIVDMLPPGSRDAACVTALTRRLVVALSLSKRAIVRTQSPLRLGRYSEPEPDLAVVRQRRDEYEHDQPGPDDTLLVIEVADGSLALDQGLKLELYAQAGIPEVWILDLTTDTVEIHRHPEAGKYATKVRHTSGPVAPAAFPDLEVEVGEILAALD